MQRALVDEFPELADELADDADRPYMQLGHLARFTQKAKGAADWSTYDRCISFAGRFFSNAAPELEGAFRVAYLEHLDFDGVRGPDAWKRLTPPLQAAWKSVTAENARRTALPHKRPR